MLLAHNTLDITCTQALLRSLISEAPLLTRFADEVAKPPRVREAVGERFQPCALRNCTENELSFSTARQAGARDTST